MINPTPEYIRLVPTGNQSGILDSKLDINHLIIHMRLRHIHPTNRDRIQFTNQLQVCNSPTTRQEANLWSNPLAMHLCTTHMTITKLGFLLPLMTREQCHLPELVDRQPIPELVTLRGRFQGSVNALRHVGEVHRKC